MIDVSFNRTKIVATIGPATSSTKKLVELVSKGIDVCRLNFSHGAHEDHQKVLNTIRDINEKYGTNVALLQDLQGPKIRIGKLDEDYPIKRGKRFFINTKIEEREGDKLPIQYETFAKDVEAGAKILVNDGKVELKVISTNRIDEVEVEVIFGSEISSKKGVNLPNTKISMPCLTSKDLKDLEFGIENKVDWIAISFVRSVGDVHQLKEILKSRNSHSKVIAKIEKPEALAEIEEIIEATDAIMIARGDLGVEICMEDVPIWQKKIVKICNAKGKPVIVATQMMESMLESPTPTRAEANDVANAIVDGADAVMLSGETSVGQFPVQAVESMQKIIASVEKNFNRIYYKNMNLDKYSETFLSDSISVNACRIAEEVSADALIGMTHSGYTAYIFAKCRPKAKIFIFTSNKPLLTQLSLIWGVRGFYYDGFESTDDTIKDVQSILVEKGLIKDGELILNTASMPMKERGRTNMVKLTVIGKKIT